MRRVDLVDALAAGLPPGSVRLGQPIRAVDGDGDARTKLVLEDGRCLSCRLLIGTDGVRSVVASHLGLPPANYAGG